MTDSVLFSDIQNPYKDWIRPPPLHLLQKPPSSRRRWARQHPSLRPAKCKPTTYTLHPLLSNSRPPATLPPQPAGPISLNVGPTQPILPPSPSKRSPPRIRFRRRPSPPPGISSTSTARASRSPSRRAPRRLYSTEWASRARICTSPKSEFRLSGTRGTPAICTCSSWRRP